MSSAATACLTQDLCATERPIERCASESQITAVTYDERLANAARCDGFVDPRPFDRCPPCPT